MLKEKTAMLKASSKRNRHNGRVNAWKQFILEKGRTFQTADGRQYKALFNNPEVDEKGQPLPGQLIKSIIVRVPQGEVA